MKFNFLEETSDNKYQLTTETQLLNSDFYSKIETLFNSGREGFFPGENNINIYYKIFSNPNEKGAILISSGRSESTLKYKETIFDFFNNGFSIYIFDHRGQGFSDRMLPNKEMGFVDNFENYLLDMKNFYDEFVACNNHKQIFLLSHSLGGTIGFSYLEKYPEDFDAAIFTSPMLGLRCPTCEIVGLKVSNKPEFVVRNSYGENVGGTFENNLLTSSEIRFNISKKEIEENPDAKLGEPTYHWVYEVCKEFDNIFKNCGKIETPVLFFSAEKEGIIDPLAHVDFLEELEKFGKKIFSYKVKKGRHELLIEKDEIRIPVLTKTLDFINSYLKNKKVYSGKDLP